MFSFFTQSKKRRTAARPSYRPMLETLEDRCVPSGAPLDPSFGTNGVVTTSLAGATTVLGDLLQPNGDIIAYGAFGAGSSLFLARYTPTGSLDTTFGSGGLVETTTPGNNDNTGQAALQTNRQIVFVSGGWLFRYNSNGSLDTTFGSDGVVTLPSGFATVSGFNKTEPGLLIQPSNGDIVVGGSSGSDSALLAYTPSGTLDSTFGNGGEVLTPGGAFHALALENDDIVAGGADELARYTLSGSLDTTFGSSGIAAFPGTVKSLLVQANGQIIAFGQETVSNTLEWALARYNVNGTLDTTFGSGGVVTSSPSGDDKATGAALESDGLIVVAGLADLAGTEFGIYNPNGSPDASFGSGGFVTAPWVGSSPNYAGDGILVQPNGDIVIAGCWTGTGTVGIALARYLPPVAQTNPSFAFTGPSSVTAGAAGSFTVTALNADGSIDTSYTGTVQFTSSDPNAVLPADYTFTAADQGVYTFSATLVTAGSQSITVADTSNGSIIGSESGIIVTPAAASQVVFTQVPSSGVAGQTLGTVQAAMEDAYGNVETGDNSDQITVSVNTGPSTQLGGTLTETVQAGIATFSNLQLNTSGSYSLAAQANLASGGTLGPVVSSGIAVASPVSLNFGNITYNSKTGLYSETVTLTNTTSGTLTGPMSLELTNLPSGVELTDATGTTNGNPYVRFLASGKTLKKGASTSITLTFTAASASDITFGTEVVVGL